jgi:ATP-binding cassette subfamily C protein CydD
VSQKPYLFHQSIGENIRLADSAVPMSRVIEAAKNANIHEFIESLPGGYDTIVGEQGARLSGGQAQRIALARAFLKDAPFLILDEPTANLDPRVEAQIRQSIEKLLAGRTVLLIAHRLNTVFNVDRIIVMAEGKIREQGTHQGLLEQDGLYRQLIRAYRG